MFPTLRRSLALALLGTAALSTPWATAQPDPLDATAAVPPATHRSAFAGYRPAVADTPVADWRKANDRVDQIGGWRTYAREAAAPASAPASAPQREGAAR